MHTAYEKSTTVCWELQGDICEARAAVGELVAEAFDRDGGIFLYF
jgi:hypothetical protein